MNHIYNIVFFFLLASNVLGQQNLILNGDFEEYWECPDDATQIERCKNVYNPLPFDDLLPFSSTSDYYNACYSSGSSGSAVGVPNTMGGYQFPFFGNGMLGFGSFDNFNIDHHHREYVQLSFSNTLVCGKKYAFTAYFNLSSYFRYSAKSLGFYFSEEELNEQDYLYNLYQPLFIDSATEINDTAIWTKLTFEFVADEPYQFVSIGHTKFDDSSSYFEVDETAPGQTYSTYFFIDSTSLIEIGPSEIVFPNVFTPNGDGINDYFEPLSAITHLDQIVLFNRWGNEIRILEAPFKWDGLSQSGQTIVEGVYFYICRPKKECIERKENYIIQGMIHLIR